MVPRNEQHPRPPPAPRLWSRLSTISKKSLRSLTSSFEADDERSSSDDEHHHHRHYHYTGSMSRSSSDDRSFGLGGGGEGGPPTRYVGEDSRPTSSKELAGWYAYAFAAETYVICGMCSATSSVFLTGTDLRLWTID